MTADLRANLQSSLGDAYKVRAEIGGGGMSRVYVAEETALNRRIVVKVLPPELAGEVTLTRFQREITLAARLQHPHIVPLLTWGETRGLPYYTMPFVDGESLRQRLDRTGELPVAEAVRLLREIATALAYAHDNGIVHRDIKPANVLLSGGVALVADFGVAKALMASATTDRPLTSTGIAIGTPAYMSPEQVAADPGVDHRADIYSFGMLAYEMLAGQPPFVGRSAQALLSAHVMDAPEPLERRRPAVPLALAALVMRCLEKRPADRPQDAHEIVRAIDALATPAGTAASSGGALVSARVGPARRGSRAMLGAVAIVLLMAGGATWFALNYRARGSAASRSSPSSASVGPPPVSIPAIEKPIEKPVEKPVEKPAPVAHTSSPISERSTAAADSRVLVVPFTNLTGNPAFDKVGWIAADQLAATVAQAGAIDVVPFQTILQAFRDTTLPPADQIQRLTEATHTRFVVTGMVTLRGDSLALQAQMSDARSGKAHTVFDPAMSSTADPTVALNALSGHLLGALGIRRFAQLQQRGFRAPSYAAEQEFAKGMELFAMKGDGRGAIPFFKQAIALDSTFTRAYLTLEQQYINLGDRERFDSVTQRIDRLPRLTEAERLQLAYHRAQMTDDVPAQLQTLQHLAALDSSALWLELTGVVANDLLRPDLAVPAIEAGRETYTILGPFARGQTFVRLLEAYHQAGTHDRELRLANDLPAKYPDLGDARIPRLRAYAGLAQGKSALALADTIFREASSTSGVPLLSAWTGAQEFRAHGDGATASALLKLAREWMAAHATAATNRGRQSLEGAIFLTSGMADSALVRFALAADKAPVIELVGYLAVAQAMIGDRVHAQAIADSLGALDRAGLHGEHKFWQAAIVGALGDRALAVQLLQKARDGGRSMSQWHYQVALQSLHGYRPFETLVRPKR